MTEPKKPKGMFKCSASHVLDGSKLMLAGKIWVCSADTQTGLCLHSVRRVCSFSGDELEKISQSRVFLIT